MSILFYDHLIDRTPIHLHLQTLDIPQQKKDSFKQKIDDIIHSGILEVILQKLHPHHHHTFLDQLKNAPYDPHLLVYLKNNAGEDIEKEIIQQSERLIKLILKDLSTTDEK